MVMSPTRIKNSQGMSLAEILVGIVFLSLMIFVFSDAIVSGKKTTKAYSEMEDEMETIISPLQFIKNDFRYAEDVQKVGDEYRIVFKQFDADPANDRKYINKIISYKHEADAAAPDGTPNRKIIRTVSVIGGASTTTEFKKIAGVRWCVDGLDVAADCPNIGATPGSGKISTSGHRFIVEFSYRAGLKQVDKSKEFKALRKKFLIASSENMPPDGGFVNPILIRP